ncbi:hypothetical protein HKD37_14G040928 [Glycine soja]
MSAFVEHWHNETSSFHLPIREVTITLDDVTSLLHLPIVGTFHSFEQLHVDNIVNMLVELLECWIYEHFPSIGSTIDAEDYDEKRLCACRWTSSKALPVSTYHRGLDRLTPDVVCWISYGDHCSIREFEVISLFSGHLRWGSLTVIHRPDRVVRQFGYIQTIPPYPTAPSVSVEEMDARWMQFGDYVAPVGQICVVPGQCSSDYMEWFYMISHPFFTPAQPEGPSRVPPIQQYDTFFKPDVYQQSVAATTPDEADIEVHHPGHAVDGYVEIADKLERLLNLRILTEGTEAYTVAEECLSITRSYFGQSTVGHRSRHRRRTDVIEVVVFFALYMTILIFG